MKFCLILILLVTTIQARWIRYWPNFLSNKKMIEAQNGKESLIFPTLPRELHNKSEKVIMDRYCRFLLGACDVWMKKYREFQLRKLRENARNEEIHQAQTGRKIKLWKLMRKLKKSKHQTGRKLPTFPTLPKELENKSEKEIMDKYCRFSLGVCDVWMKKYREFKQRKWRKNARNKNIFKAQRGRKSPIFPTLPIPLGLYQI